MGRLEYHRRDYNESGYLELRRCGWGTYFVFGFVLLGSYLALGILGSRNIL
nr:photosystem II 47 kDa protein [Helleborus thibetanus]